VIPIARGRGYGEGLDAAAQMDIPNATRPGPIVPIERIHSVRERIDYKGGIVMSIDEEDLRAQLRDLVGGGAEALVVSLTNSVVNPAHELRIREIFLEEYPAHMLGAIPMVLSHQVAGRKGEYVRGIHHTNTIESHWGHFKRSVARTHVTVSQKHLWKYIAEFTYRRNYRSSHSHMFNRLVSAFALPRLQET
jgi:hypothetical protein